MIGAAASLAGRAAALIRQLRLRLQPRTQIPAWLIDRKRDFRKSIPILSSKVCPTLLTQTEFPKSQIAACRIAVASA
jgi:hypothetical protein